MLSAGSINAETKLVLVNAVYFRGKWSEEFDKAYTREMPFQVNQVGEASEHPENLVKKLKNLTL